MHHRTADHAERRRLTIGKQLLNLGRQVTTEEAEKKAQEFNVMFIETSAKAGHNVKVLFKKIAQALPGMDKDADAANGGPAANKSKCSLQSCF